MDEYLLNKTRVVSPADSNFSFQTRMSSPDKMPSSKEDYQLSRLLLESRQSYIMEDGEEGRLSVNSDARMLSRSGKDSAMLDLPLSARSNTSAISSRPGSPVKGGRVSERSQSAVLSGRRPSAKRSLKKRPKSAFVSQNGSKENVRHDYSYYERADSLDTGQKSLSSSSLAKTSTPAAFASPGHNAVISLPHHHFLAVHLSPSLKLQLMMICNKLCHREWRSASDLQARGF
jgi:hypothetical protein